MFWNIQIILVSYNQELKFSAEFYCFRLPSSAEKQDFRQKKHIYSANPRKYLQMRIVFNEYEF